MRRLLLAKAPRLRLLALRTKVSLCNFAPVMNHASGATGWQWGRVAPLVGAELDSADEKLASILLARAEDRCPVSKRLIDTLFLQTP